MDAQKSKAIRALRRKRHVRKTIRGTATKPRLSVHRSNQHIYAQLIDDEKGVTLAAVSSNDKGSDVTYGGNIDAATVIGKKLAEKAKAVNIAEAAFDRGAYRFHGRVKALARAATDAGLKCTGPEETTKKVKAPAAAAAAPKVKGESKKPVKA